MPNSTCKPFPCRNPDNFSKYCEKKELGKKTDDKMPVVHRNVEGENNGECFKIKGPKTPFLLTHLEKNYVDKPKEEPTTSEPTTSKGTKREHSVSDSDQELEDPNEPSTSSSTTRKRPRAQQNS
ncbi:hypothetical protein GCK72_002561 [Caenorhabditis remanei]|uniref:Uncharacterized protein n=2 Tax=Caenorhabditis remanei TaxID=31234 RepID=E3LVI3_CAERE|nr:hypothetical protein GCK72_002561 [Caenorhabditis remanei]EFP12633.1 hypothetical protein CRE_29530 [Caenorhabditis remanei]KAF1770738.1 hypothetical protein GCK72_002561 [Caenorhabditis remanei]